MRAAQPHFAQAVILDPSRSGAWTDLGVTLMRAQDFQDSKRVLERAIELNPQDENAKANRRALQGWLDSETRG